MAAERLAEALAELERERKKSKLIKLSLNAYKAGREETAPVLVADMDLLVKMGEKSSETQMNLALEIEELRNELRLGTNDSPTSSHVPSSHAPDASMPSEPPRKTQRMYSRQLVQGPCQRRLTRAEGHGRSFDY